MAKKGAKVYEFPLERRQKQIAEENRRVVGKAAGPSENGFVQVELTGNTTVAAEVVTGSVSTAEMGEPWWQRIPSFSPVWNDRRAWMKIGGVGLLAKRHRVVTLVWMDGGVWATAACGRRGILSDCFDDAMSGGDCARCRARGYR